MEKINVEYSGGESRKSADMAVGYMLANVGDIELYAEAPTVDGDEDANYDDLVQEIRDQAREYGVPVESLRFWHDEEADSDGKD